MSRKRSRSYAPIPRSTAMKRMRESSRKARRSRSARPLSRKYFDYQIGGGAVGSQVTVPAPNANTLIDDSVIKGITQGSGDQQRDGRMCTIKAIGMKYSVRVKGEALSTDPNCGAFRIIVYWDKQAQGTDRFDRDWETFDHHVAGLHCLVLFL